MFDKQFVESLPENLPLALRCISGKFSKVSRDLYAKYGHTNILNAVDLYLEAYGFFQAFSEANGLKINFPPLESAEDAVNIVTDIFNNEIKKTIKRIRSGL